MDSRRTSAAPRRHGWVVERTAAAQLSRISCTSPQHLGHAGGGVGAGKEGGFRQAAAAHQQVHTGVQPAQQEVADEGDVLLAGGLCTWNRTTATQGNT